MADVNSPRDQQKLQVEDPNHIRCRQSIAGPASLRSASRVQRVHGPPTTSWPAAQPFLHKTFRGASESLPQVSKHHTCPQTSSSNQSQTHGLTVWLGVGVHEWRYCSSLSLWSRPCYLTLDGRGISSPARKIATALGYLFSRGMVRRAQFSSEIPHAISGPRINPTYLLSVLCQSTIDIVNYSTHHWNYTPTWLSTPTLAIARRNG